MEFDEEFELGHLLFNERKCRTCNKKKDLLTDFYLIRKTKKDSHQHTLTSVKNVQKLEL